MTEARTNAEMPDDESDERESFMDVLKVHGHIKEADAADASLGPGQTHLLLEGKDGGTAILVEKRKTFF